MAVSQEQVEEELAKPRCEECNCAMVKVDFCPCCRKLVLPETILKNIDKKKKKKWITG